MFLRQQEPNNTEIGNFGSKLPILGKLGPEEKKIVSKYIGPHVKKKKNK